MPNLETLTVESDKDLRGSLKLKYATELISLSISSQDSRSDCLETLTELEALESLKLNLPLMANDGLDQLKYLSSLRILDLEGSGAPESGFTGVGLANLKLLPIASLNLSMTGVRTEHLEQLRELRSLQQLVLHRTEGVTEPRLQQRDLNKFAEFPLLQLLTVDARQLDASPLKNEGILISIPHHLPPTEK